LRVLVTNDDGVLAPGIRALAAALAADGHDVVVVAPLEDRSGAAAGIGPVHLDNSIEFEEAAIPGWPDLPAYGIDGLPAMAVMAAALGGFGPAPHLVASGINLGLNTGRAVLHSGTVGAALTAANFGIPALAASLEASETMHWATASTLATMVARRLLAASAPAVVNLNVPNRELGDLNGLRAAHLARTGTVQSSVAEIGSGRLQLQVGPPSPTPAQGTDVALVGAGYATVTPITGVSEAAGTAASEVLEAILEAWPEAGIA
jgi:5'-nucleotidase